MMSTKGRMKPASLGLGLGFRGVVTAGKGIAKESSQPHCSDKRCGCHSEASVAEEPGRLEGYGVGDVVHAVILVLDPFVVDLYDTKSGRVVARWIPDGTGYDHEHVAVG